MARAGNRGNEATGKAKRRRRGRRGRRPLVMVKTARQRIACLNELADRMAVDGRMDLASRYLFLAKKMGMKYNLRQPRGFRLKFCKYCRSYLMSGRNATIRLKKGCVEVRCHRCGSVKRHPYLKERRNEEQ